MLGVYHEGKRVGMGYHEQIVTLIAAGMNGLFVGVGGGELLLDDSL